MLAAYLVCASDMPVVMVASVTQADNHHRRAVLVIQAIIPWHYCNMELQKPKLWLKFLTHCPSERTGRSPEPQRGVLFAPRTNGTSRLERGLSFSAKHPSFNLGRLVTASKTGVPNPTVGCTIDNDRPRQRPTCGLPNPSAAPVPIPAQPLVVVCRPSPAMSSAPIHHQRTDLKEQTPTETGRPRY